MGLESLALDTVVGAATDSFGGEFLASDVFADTTTVFDTVTPVSDFASVDAYQSVGSFAGNSEWVNTFQPGSINTDVGGIVVDDQGIPLLSQDVQTINNGSLTPSLYDTAYATAADTVTSIKDAASTFTDKLTGYLGGGGNVVDTAGNQISNPQIVVDDQGVPLLEGDVAQINRGVLTDPLAGLNAQTVQRAFGQLTGQGTGYGSTGGGVPQLINYLAGGGVNNSAGYGLGTPGYAGGYIGTPGIVAGTGGYPTGGIGSTGGINTGSLLNNALAFVTGSTSAQAQTTNNAPGAVTDWNAVPSIEITGVGVNTGNTIVANANLTTSVSANYQEIYNPTTGKWDVRETTTNTIVASGLTQQDAIIQAQDLAITQPAITVNTGPSNQQGIGSAFNAVTGALNPGYIIGAGGVPVFVGTGATNATSTAAGTVQALVQQAQQQQTIRDQRQNKAQSTDWRVRLRLAPQSNYLYNDPNCGPVLWPLHVTDGVIFPYTPNIDIGYKANYDPYDLTHSNYRGYFYKGSYIDAVNLRATFTAQDTNEANYLLAVIHFFRSVTKMFYGQDAQRGSPPPLTYLSGLGDFQFNEHPCVVSQFNYSLPADVDYIRAQSTTSNGTNLLQNRTRQSANSLFYGLTRLASVGLPKGALSGSVAGGTLGVGNATYVPTKMDIQLTLLPIQSRSQVSQQFSLRNFANGNLLKGGFW